MTTKWKLVVALILLLVVFLIGYIPQYRESQRLESEVESLRAELAVARIQIHIDAIRNLAGRMLLAASHQNYGLARDLSTEYFNKMRELMAEAPAAEIQASVSKLLEMRDEVTAGLAQGSPDIVAKLQLLLQMTYEIPNA